MRCNRSSLFRVSTLHHVEVVACRALYGSYENLIITDYYADVRRPQTAEQRTTKIENVITFHSRKCFHSRFEIVRCFIGRQPSSVTYLIQGISSHLTSECYRFPVNRFSILNSTPSQPTVQRRKRSTSEPLALGNYRLNCD